MLQKCEHLSQTIFKLTMLIRISIIFSIYTPPLRPTTHTHTQFLPQNVFFFTNKVFVKKQFWIVYIYLFVIYWLIWLFLFNYAQDFLYKINKNINRLSLVYLVKFIQIVFAVFCMWLNVMGWKNGNSLISSLLFHSEYYIFYQTF